LCSDSSSLSEQQHIVILQVIYTIYASSKQPPRLGFLGQQLRWMNQIHEVGRHHRPNPSSVRPAFHATITEAEFPPPCTFLRVLYITKPPSIDFCGHRRTILQQDAVDLI